MYSKSNKEAVCITSGNPSPQKGLISMEFDSAEVEYREGSVFQFQYVEDPTVTVDGPINGIVSGGVRLTIMGTNLDTIQQPRIAVYKDGIKYPGVSSH